MKPFPTAISGELPPINGRAGSSFDSYTLAVNPVLPDPAIDAPAVVPNLESLALNGSYQVQILGAVHLTQDNVANLQVRDFDRDNRA